MRGGGNAADTDAAGVRQLLGPNRRCGRFAGRFTVSAAASRAERSLNLRQGMSVGVCSAVDLTNQGRLFVRPTSCEPPGSGAVWRPVGPRPAYASTLRAILAEVAALMGVVAADRTGRCQ